MCLREPPPVLECVRRMAMAWADEGVTALEGPEEARERAALVHEGMERFAHLLADRAA